jgi:hypothetical protein
VHEKKMKITGFLATLDFLFWHVWQANLFRARRLFTFFLTRDDPTAARGGGDGVA